MARDYDETLVLCRNCRKEFLPKSRVHKFCSEKCKGEHKYKTGHVTTQSQYEYISGNWKRYLSRLLYVNGRKREKLTQKDLLDLIEKQNYKCAISGISLTCNLEKSVNFLFNASVDRINAGKEYTIDNIQLVCKCLNKWRADTDLSIFIEICRKVAKHNE
jgi:hypothetical protein